MLKHIEKVEAKVDSCIQQKIFSNSRSVHITWLQESLLVSGTIFRELKDSSFFIAAEASLKVPPRLSVNIL